MHFWPGLNVNQNLGRDESTGTTSTTYIELLIRLLGTIFLPRQAPAAVVQHDEPTAEVVDLTLADVPMVYPLVTEESIPEIHSRLMLVLKHGFPLYEPGPSQNLPLDYRKKGVNIGDVGIVTAHGAFDFLFNVCQSHDSNINPSQLPDNFETLPSPEITISQHFEPETHLFSKGVEQIDDSPVAYQCLETEGAVLELPEGASRFEAQAKLVFRDLAALHAENWYKYMVITRSRDAPNGSLYLVTGSTKSKNWGIATFDRPSRPNDHLRFLCEESRDLITRTTYRWKKLGAVITKTGPKPPDVATTEDEEPNQCVFLQGYKITLRQDIWDSLAKARLTVPSSGGKSSTSHSAACSTNTQATSRNHNNTDHQGQAPSNSIHSLSIGGNTTIRDVFRERQDTSTSHHPLDDLNPVVLEEASSVTYPTHPSDFINAILLQQAPEAKAAITHDSDWFDLLPEDTSINNSDVGVDNLQGVARSYQVVVDKHGCVSLTKFSDSTRLSDTAPFEELCSPCGAEQQHSQSPAPSTYASTITIPSSLQNTTMFEDLCLLCGKRLLDDSRAYCSSECEKYDLHSPSVSSASSVVSPPHLGLAVRGDIPTVDGATRSPSTKSILGTVSAMEKTDSVPRPPVQPPYSLSYASGTSDDIFSSHVFSWTNKDPRESQLFNSWGVLYRFQTVVNTGGKTDGKPVTTLWKMILPNEENRVAKFEWSTNGGLGRIQVGKTTLPMTDFVRPDPTIRGARVFNGPDGSVYRWRPSQANTDILLQDSNGEVIAFFRPTEITRYQVGDVYGELHFLRYAGAGTVMHPPMMDTVTFTAMLYRFCDAWNL